MKRFRKIYIEILNSCNLKCHFCIGTKRAPGKMGVPEMEKVLHKVRDYTDFVYFHLMGEPLMHPEMETFLQMAEGEGLKVILTTNGTLLSKKEKVLQEAKALHKVNISLHSFEANELPEGEEGRDLLENYLDDCLTFGKKAEGKMIVVYRLWNEGGEDRKNQQILEKMHARFPGEWVTERKGIRIGEKIYLEYGEKFDWPDLEASEAVGRAFCYGLKDQLGILADGTVVPCCLDHEGDIALGNIFTQDLDEILKTERAEKLLEGFRKGICSEELCLKCGYRTRFS